LLKPSPEVGWLAVWLIAMSEFSDSHHGSTVGTPLSSKKAGSRGSYRPASGAGSDWANNFNFDVDELGDLSDVPQAYLKEVVDILRSLPGPLDDLANFGIDSLRTWILALVRLAGVSRECAVQLFAAISQVLQAPRPKGPCVIITTVVLQNAFVRMDGVRQTLTVMLMRLDDSEVVAAACHALAAAAQGSPLSVGAMLDHPNDIRLLLRAIERHQGDIEVAEAGASLIAHLCSQTSFGGNSASPARAKPHRECQIILAESAIDILVNVLGISVENVREKAADTEALQGRARVQAETKVLPKAGHARISDGHAASKGLNEELCHAWEDLNEAEAHGARVQASALQALILLAFGNPETTRQLAGQLWCHANISEREAAEKAAAVELEIEEAKQKGRRKSAATRSEDKKKIADQLKEAQNSADDAPPPEFELPQGDARRALTTMDAFARTATLMIQILRGRATRDRPELAAKACRVLGLLAERALSLLKQIEEQRSKQYAELAVTLRYTQADPHNPGPLPVDDCWPTAPFAPIEPLITTLTYVVRTHQNDTPLLAEAMSLLMKLKQFALMAAPAGVQRRSEVMLYAWQHLLGDSVEGDELELTNNVLKKAYDATAVGNSRIRNVGATAEDMTGDAVFLTPRMHRFVLETQQQASELSGDAIARRWRNGEPKRKDKKNEKNAENLPKEGRYGRRATVAQGIGQSPSNVVGRRSSAVGLSEEQPIPVSHAPAAPGKNGADAAQRRGTGKGSGKGKGASKGKAVHIPEEKKVKPPPEHCEWKRAIGFDTYDESDFQRMWHDPLKDALKRSLDMPSIKSQRQDKIVMGGLLEGVGGGELRPNTASSALSVPGKELELNFISSAVGVLKCQIIIDSRDPHHQVVNDLRVKNLTDVSVSGAEVAPVITKHFRKQGKLIPEYGLQVVFKKGRRESMFASTGANLMASPSKPILRASIQEEDD